MLKQNRSCPEVEVVAGQLEAQNPPHFHKAPRPGVGTEPAPAVPPAIWTRAPAEACQLGLRPRMLETRA